MNIKKSCEQKLKLFSRNNNSVQNNNTPSQMEDNKQEKICYDLYLVVLQQLHVVIHRTFDRNLGNEGIIIDILLGGEVWSEETSSWEHDMKGIFLLQLLPYCLLPGQYILRSFPLPILSIITSCLTASQQWTKTISQNDFVSFLNLQDLSMCSADKKVTKILVPENWGHYCDCT